MWQNSMFMYECILYAFLFLFWLGLSLLSGRKKAVLSLTIFNFYIEFLTIRNSQNEMSRIVLMTKFFQVDTLS